MPDHTSPRRADDRLRQPRSPGPSATFHRVLKTWLLEYASHYALSVPLERMKPLSRRDVADIHRRLRRPA